MKKLIILLLALLVLAGCSPKAYTAENIGALYDRETILGMSREAVQQKYGPFKREYTLDDGREVGAWYVNYDNRGPDPSYIHDTYFVEFKADKAVDAWFARTSIGG